ncbi:MAG: hypothetical protein L0177_08875 [Chloroflexi bacterium]|nr:hypothetical protein [Chloroflexota bacterium]
MPFHDPHEDKEFQDKASGRKADVEWRQSNSGLLSLVVIGAPIVIFIVLLWIFTAGK